MNERGDNLKNTNRTKSNERYDSHEDWKPRVPRAVPELMNDDVRNNQPGVDDGLFSTDDVDNEENSRKSEQRRSTYLFPDQDGTTFIDINGVPTPLPDVNVYQHKKTLAQGMMDLALLSANANQLRYVLETYDHNPYYYASIFFIILSIIFQIAVGVGLILNSRYNIKNENHICFANKVNNYTVIGIFIVTVVNVFISAFGAAGPRLVNDVRK